MRAIASHTHPAYALCITVDIAHEYNLPKGLGFKMTTCLLPQWIYIFDHLAGGKIRDKYENKSLPADFNFNPAH